MVLPTALLFTTLIMSLFWYLPANAHMRSLRVVEVNDTAKFQLADFSGRDGHLVEPLAFEDAVGTLRDGIFQRVSTLGHANADAMLLELGYISVTTILAATIGMVDKPAGGLVTNLPIWRIKRRTLRRPTLKLFSRRKSVIPTTPLAGCSMCSLSIFFIICRFSSLSPLGL